MSAAIPPTHLASEQAPHMAVMYCYVIEHDDGTRVYFSGFDREIHISNIPASICPDGEVTFLPSQIKHGAVTSNDKFEERSTLLTIDSKDERIRRFFVTAAAVKLRAWIIRVSDHEIEDEVDFTKSCFVSMSGILSKFAFSGQTIAAEVTPDPFFVNFSVPRMWFQRQCNHALYGAGCRLGKADFAFTTTIDSINAADRTLVLVGRKSGAGADYFTAGMFDHPATGLPFSIGLSDYSVIGKTKLKLGYWHPELAPGQAVTAYAGCRHTVDDCTNKFGNGANFGGFPFVPSRNPVTDNAG